MKLNIWLVALGIILGMALITWIGIAFLAPHNFHGTVIQSPNPAPDFSLNASNGEKISLSEYRGKLVLLYFGYTYCPDVCPATLATIKQALAAIGEKKASRVQVIMISVDPKRDTPEQLARYLANYGPSFIGATGTPEEIAAVATLYGIFFEAHEGSAATGYLVDHTATLMVIDPDGRLKLVLPFGTTTRDMADDLNYMLR